MAKAVEKPLWRLLGGAKEKKIKTYNTDGGWLNKSVDEIIENMKQILDEGMRASIPAMGKASPCLAGHSGPSARSG